MAAYERYLSMDPAALDGEIEKQKAKIHAAKAEIRLLKKLKIAAEADTRYDNSAESNYGES